MKLLVGDGSYVEIRDVSEIIYKMNVKKGLMLPLHGFKIMTDNDARSFISRHKDIAKCLNLKGE